jgi:hypothetical protein
MSLLITQHRKFGRSGGSCLLSGYVVHAGIEGLAGRSLRRHCRAQVGGGRRRIFRSFSLSAVQFDLSGSLAASRVTHIMRPRAFREQGRRSYFTGESAARRQRRRRSASA